MQTEGFLDPANVLTLVDIREGMKIADFGCGAGHFTILMAQKVGKDGMVTALDIQEGPLDAVHAKAKISGLNNINTVRANLEVPGSSKLQDSSQDIVLMANILFQSPKKKELIQEARRVLKDQGQLVIVEWKKGGGGMGLPDQYRLGEEEIKYMVQETGLKLEKTFLAGSFHHGFIFRK